MMTEVISELLDVLKEKNIQLLGYHPGEEDKMAFVELAITDQNTLINIEQSLSDLVEFDYSNEKGSLKMKTDKENFIEMFQKLTVLLKAFEKKEEQIFEEVLPNEISNESDSLAIFGNPELESGRVR